MRIRFILFLAALACTVKTSAQTGVYGAFTGSDLSSIKAPYPYTQSTSVKVVGGTFGIYNNFVHAGPVRLGIDLRGNILDSKGRKLNSGLGGLRVEFRAPAVPLRPYLQALAGVGDTNFGSGSITTTGFMYQFLGGLDLNFFPRLDWRVIEIGGGALHARNTNYPLATISTGIVLRLR